MPALWQSSQRPMYVRTVWVDGFRHAILTHDDPYLLKLPKRRRPYSSASTKTRLNQDEEYPRRLNLVVNSGKSVITSRPKSAQTVEQLNLTDIEQDSDEELLKVSPQPLNENAKQDFYNMKNFRANKTARTEAKDTELSDRVLQWLDLAGKVDLLAPGNERMAQPRHSWPEIQRRHNLLKSKTAIDIRAKEKVTKLDSPKAQQNGTIDRHDFYVATSANTIENYARQSRNKTPRDTQKTANNKMKPSTKASVVETRQKVASERNAVEKQYAELINKKVIPDVNKNTKKQVHIFIPEMAKRPGYNGSATASGADSLLSHHALKLLRH